MYVCKCHDKVHVRNGIKIGSKGRCMKKEGLKGVEVNISYELNLFLFSDLFLKL